MRRILAVAPNDLLILEEQFHGMSLADTIAKQKPRSKHRETPYRFSYYRIADGSERRPYRFWQYDPR